jgi:L-asparaginase/Glu-tRNA(Gln) amidotransferase subunit D
MKNELDKLFRNRLFIRYEQALSILSADKTPDEIKEIKKSIKIAIDNGEIDLEFDQYGRMILSQKVKGVMQ